MTRHAPRATRPSLSTLQKRAVRFNNSIVIPYRSFLPAAFDARRPWADEGSAARRPLLLFGALNLRRHWMRGQLVEVTESSTTSFVIRGPPPSPLLLLLTD